MGDEVPTGSELQIVSPQPARFVVFKNGQPVSELNGNYEGRFTANGPGTYRVEAVDHFKPDLRPVIKRFKWPYHQR
jgi:hypothetical protein